jgi:hypothetical protein
MSLKASFVSYLSTQYPDLKTDLLDPLVSDELLSSFQIELSREQIRQLQKEISQYWQLRNWGVENLQAEYQAHGLRRPNNYSACMSYDFHINTNGRPELIEINTNASFLALGLTLYDFLKLKNPVEGFNEQALVDMFLNEITLSDKNEKSIAIIDENPSSQRLFLEFLIYQKIFKKFNVQSDILNIDQTAQMQKSSLVYNRYTDFFLQEEKSAEIKKLFNSGEINLSPNPYEYFLLADKQRLLDWNQQTEVTRPESLLKIYDLGKEEQDKIWSERKSLFFKPKNSFGGKQAYRGSSMSHKAFESVFNEHFVAQQISPPPEITFDYNNQPLQLKYDLRCFAYKDQLQMIIARLYQGQTTNLKTKGGGFAVVVEKN